MRDAERKEKWRGAVEASRGIQGFWKQVATVLAGGVCAIAALLLFASDSAAQEELLAVAGSLVGVCLCVPLAEILWHYRRAPWVAVDKQIAELEQAVDELAALVRPDVATHTEILRQIRDEAKDNERLLLGVRERGTYWKVTEGAPRMKQWKKHRALVSRQPDLERLAELGRAAESELERLLQTRAVRALFRDRRVRSDDRLDDVIEATRNYKDAAQLALDS